MSETSPHHQYKHRSLKRTLATVALMAAHQVTPADCFANVAPSKPATSSHRFFTVDETIELKQGENFYNPLLSVSHSATKSVSKLGGDDEQLPTWLRLQKAHLVHENHEKLRQTMLKTFFTENEVLKLTYAIQEAADGDDNKMSGAAEFCLIMVETMEMGLDALIAAAFHYCHCVAAREKSMLPQMQSDLLAAWEVHQHHGIESFGPRAVHIERDASRLKRLEMVASMVVNTSSSSSSRVTPDAEAADNLKNLFLTEAKDWRALAIRGAACLYRLRGILDSDGANILTKESSRVCREALRIYAPLASRLGMHRLKNELEAAAFRILYRRQYETVSSLLHQTRDSQSKFHFARRQVAKASVKKSQGESQMDIGESMGQILFQVQTEMTDRLKNDPEFTSSVEDFTVTARVKESYSTWKKMLRNKFDHILQVPDALALRIVLQAKKEYDEEPDEVTRGRERALCYYAQKLCMERWAPNKEDPRFKDYIAMPKANGYQSLHYTASTEFQEEDWSMEIQVRSREMHNIAEFGVGCAHWDYKARNKPVKKTQSDHDMFTINEHFGKVLIQNEDAYLRSLQQWHWQQHGVHSTIEDDFSQASEEDKSHILSDAFFSNSSAESRLRTERIRACTQRLTPYIEALTTAQSDLARQNVFVFLSKSETNDFSEEGTVVALPAGAVVLDAIRFCELPASMEEQIQHNGAPAGLTSRLSNGDVLTIPSLKECAVMSSRP